MGDSYDRIKEKEVAESYLQKAEVLVDIDAVFGRFLKKRARCFPRFLHIRRPSGEVEENRTEWQGKIKALERTFSRQISQQDQQLAGLQHSNEQLRDSNKKQLALLKELSIGRSHRNSSNSKVRTNKNSQRNGEIDRHSNCAESDFGCSFNRCVCFLFRL